MDTAGRAALAAAYGCAASSARSRHRGGHHKGFPESVIAECGYRDGRWRVLRGRSDKRKPNSLRTAWAAVESLADALACCDVCTALQRGEHAHDTRQVAQHYDKAQRGRDAANTANARARAKPTLAAGETRSQPQPEQAVDAMRGISAFYFHTRRYESSIRDLAQAFRTGSFRGEREKTRTLSRSRLSLYLFLKKKTVGKKRVLSLDRCFEVFFCHSATTTRVRYRLRRLNNLVKAVLITRFCGTALEEADAASFAARDRTHELDLAPALAALRAPEADRSHAGRRRRPGGRAKKPHETKPRASILELACGRGGQHETAR